jgi:hypothetical protein
MVKVRFKAVLRHSPSDNETNLENVNENSRTRNTLGVYLNYLR